MATAIREKRPELRLSLTPLTRKMRRILSARVASGKVAGRSWGVVGGVFIKGMC